MLILLLREALPVVLLAMLCFSPRKLPFGFSCASGKPHNNLSRNDRFFFHFLRRVYFLRCVLSRPFGIPLVNVEKALFWLWNSAPGYTSAAIVGPFHALQSSNDWPGFRDLLSSFEASTTWEHPISQSFRCDTECEPPHNKEFFWAETALERGRNTYNTGE